MTDVDHKDSPLKDPVVHLKISAELPANFPSADNLDNLLRVSIGKIIDDMDIWTDVDRIEISVTITGDDDIRRINREFRRIDSPTDVLSFPMYDSGGIEGCKNMDAPVTVGDIVMSLETIIRQADERGMSAIERFSECLVHGILHLAGFRHDEVEERKNMESLEDELIPQVKSILEKTSM